MSSNKHNDDAYYETKGATIILLSHVEAGETSPCVWLVKDHTDTYTAPMETLSGSERRSAAAARAANEELHLSIPSTHVCDPSKYAMVSVPFRLGTQLVGYNAVFIARTAQDSAAFTADSFYNTKQELEANTNTAADFLECSDVERVPIAALLEAVPSNGTDADSFNIRQSPPDAHVKTASGREVPLRSAFANILAHPSVRRVLEALHEQGTAYIGRSAAKTTSDGSRGPLTLIERINMIPAAELPCNDPVWAVKKSPISGGRLWDADLVFTCPAPSVADAKADALETKEAAEDATPRTPFRLYIGALDAASDYNFLKEHNIKYVVNCCVADLGSPSKWTPHIEHGVRYATVYTNDCASSIAIQNEYPAGQWHGAMALLEDALHEGAAVLVHCWAGVNRSVTTALIFLVLNGFFPSIEDGLRYVQRSRSKAGPMPVYIGFGRRFLASKTWLPRRCTFREPSFTVAASLTGNGFLEALTNNSAVSTVAQAALSMMATKIAAKTNETDAASAAEALVSAPTPLPCDLLAALCTAEQNAAMAKTSTVAVHVQEVLQTQGASAI